METWALHTWFWEKVTSSTSVPLFLDFSVRLMTCLFTCLSIGLLLLVICALFVTTVFWAGSYPQVFKNLILFFGNFNFIFQIFFTLSSCICKLYFCASSAFSCTCLITSILRASSYVTFFFYFNIFFFSPWSFWLANCLITISANLPALVVIRTSFFVLNHFTSFLLVVFRIPGFTNWFLFSFF